jgi:putative restriction endonuclease
VPDVPVELAFRPMRTEREVSRLERVGQSFFRRSVLASYNETCCVCGINIADLLVASHIVPWSVSADLRLDPENGLCLCVLHDKAYDRGLLSLSAELQILISPRIRQGVGPFVQVVLGDFAGKRIRQPMRFMPRLDLLSWHTENIFRS